MFLTFILIMFQRNGSHGSAYLRNTRYRLWYEKYPICKLRSVIISSLLNTESEGCPYIECDMNNIYIYIHVCIYNIYIYDVNVYQIYNVYDIHHIKHIREKIFYIHIMCCVKYFNIWFAAFKNNFKRKSTFKISILHFILILGYANNLNFRHYSTFDFNNF